MGARAEQGLRSRRAETECGRRVAIQQGTEADLMADHEAEHGQAAVPGFGEGGKPGRRSPSHGTPAAHCRLRPWLPCRAPQHRRTWDGVPVEGCRQPQARGSADSGRRDAVRADGHSKQHSKSGPPRAPAMASRDCRGSHHGVEQEETAGLTLVAPPYAVGPTAAPCSWPSIRADGRQAIPQRQEP